MNLLKSKKMFSLILITSLFGCAAVGVPITFNPEKKLSYAKALFNDYDRPFPAENLIEEAVQLYERKNDEVGLANAYRTYALFLQSSAVSNWKKYRFMLDKTVTYDNRYQKALEYWEKALALYEKTSVYDMVANVYFNIGRLYSVFFENKELACDNYAKSLESHQRFRNTYPNDEIVLPEGYSSFKEYIEKVQKDAECFGT